MEEMSATRLIRDDHKRIRGLLIQLQAAELRAPEMREGISRELFMELEIHTAIEEEVLYQAIQSANDPGAKALAIESKDEHAGLLQQVKLLREIPVESGRFDEELSNLRERVASHFEMEERVTLPRSEELFPNILSDLGQRMRRRREELLSEPQYESALPGLVQNPKGGEQMRKRG